MTDRIDSAPREHEAPAPVAWGVFHVLGSIIGAEIREPEFVSERFYVSPLYRGDVVEALRAELASVRRGADEALGVIAERGTRVRALHETALWAVDLLDMYDEMLLKLGEPRERVYSATHVAAKAKARRILADAALSQPPAPE